MALKKKNFSENEIAIFEDACIYKRGEYWHFRMWLAKEKRYVKRSLKTTSRATSRISRRYLPKFLCKPEAGKNIL